MRKTRLGFVLGCFLIALAGGAQTNMVTPATAQRSASAGFHPAEYRGIKMGKSKRRDVIARFGKPQWEGLSEGGAYCLSYRDVGVVKGVVNIYLHGKVGVVSSLEIGPMDTNLEQVFNIFGKGAIETRWSEAACLALGDGIGGPSYLDPKGEESVIEYRHLGVYIKARGRLVEGITYADRPFGLDRNPCDKARKK